MIMVGGEDVCNSQRIAYPTASFAVPCFLLGLRRKGSIYFKSRLCWSVSTGS